MKRKYYKNRYCKCGCGRRIEVKKSHSWYGIPKYILGHSLIDKSDEWIGIMRKKKGKSFEQIYGKKLAKQIRENMSKSRKGHSVSKKTKEKIARRLLGKTYEELYGKEMSDKIKEKMRNNRLGKSLFELYGYKNAMKMRKMVRQPLEKRYGKLKANDMKRRISKKLQGENSYLWMGGISFEPYDINFNNSLRKDVKERDNYICQLCYKKTKNGHCHHIHYNKKDSRPEVLVWLHNGCHTLTNLNRDYWFAYFCYIKNICIDNIV